MEKKLLILDIDETLIHGATDSLKAEPAEITSWCWLYKRPHVEVFMEFCREHFRVAVWTTATPEHAHMCLSNICDSDYPFEFIWTRERCTQVRDRIGLYDLGHSYHWVKDLVKVKRHGFNLEQTIMIDDTPSAVERQYGNLIRIDEFNGEPEDRELLRLMPYLLELKEEKDIRKVEKRTWKSCYALSSEGDE